MWLFGCGFGVAVLVELLIAFDCVMVATGWAGECCGVVWMSVLR
jgi:hypothetical protein